MTWMINSYHLSVMLSHSFIFALATAIEDTEQFLWGDDVMKFACISTKYLLTVAYYCAGCCLPRSDRTPE
jgi:hypothetical protein